MPQCFWRWQMPHAKTWKLLKCGYLDAYLKPLNKSSLSYYEKNETSIISCAYNEASWKIWAVTFGAAKKERIQKRNRAYNNWVIQTFDTIVEYTDYTSTTELFKTAVSVVIAIKTGMCNFFDYQAVIHLIQPNRKLKLYRTWDDSELEEIKIQRKCSKYFSPELNLTVKVISEITFSLIIGSNHSGYWQKISLKIFYSFEVN